MKLLLIVLLGLVLLVVTALLGTVFFYAGWNWGVVPAFNLHGISLFTAFWLSLGISSVGGMLKGNASVASRD
jgi:hypothetical protein